MKIIYFQGQEIVGEFKICRGILEFKQKSGKNQNNVQNTKTFVRDLLSLLLHCCFTSTVSI